MTLLKRACLAAALLAPCCSFVSAAGAQGLALSYKLDVNSPGAQPAPVVNRCAGFNWVTSVGACGRDLLARISTRAEDDAPRGAQGAPVYEPSIPNAELPTLAVPATDSFLRSAGGKESLLGNARAVDLLVRFGSKYRVRSADEGWEWYRFTDIAYEMRRQNSLHKAVGLELLVPFQ